MNLRNIHNKYKGTVKNVSLYFSASLLKVVISLLMNPFVALNMTHTDYAITGYFGSFSSLLFPLMSFSFFQYYSKNYFRFSEDKRERMCTTISSALLLLGVLELILVFICFYVYFKVYNVSFSFFPYAFLSFSTIFFNNFFQFKLVDLKLKRDAKAFFKYNLYNTIVYSILVLVLVILLKLGALGSLTSSLLTGIIVGLYCFFKLVKKIEIDKAILKDALLFCWPLIMAGSMNYFFSGIDRAMLEQINDNYNLGLYNVAFGITGYLAIFHTAISQTFQPDIFQAVAANNKKKIIKIVGGLNLLNAIPIIAFIALAPIVIKTLTFDRYTEASQFARILALKNITSCVYFSISSIIVAYGYSKVTLLNKIIGTIICIVMFKVLISKYGFYGAAWGQVLSFFFMSVISSMFLIYKFKTRKSAQL